MHYKQNPYLCAGRALLAAGALTAALLLPGCGASSASMTEEERAASVAAAQSAAAQAEAEAQAAKQAQAEADAAFLAAWNCSNPVEATLSREVKNPDSRMTSLPQNDYVDVGYFDGVTFIGDSVTQGLQMWEAENLVTTDFCAYKGIGPDSIVNNATCERLDKSTGIPMEDIIASEPRVLYLCLGTNSMVVQGNEEAFINYYGALVDQLRASLGYIPLYIQSIPPVRPEVVQTRPGLDNARIKRVNALLSKLATEKGCYYVDTQEILAGPDGAMQETFAAADGIHLQPEGANSWIRYLACHVAYSPANSYLAQDDPFYSIFPDNMGAGAVEEEMTEGEAVGENPEAAAAEGEQTA